MHGKLGWASDTSDLFCATVSPEWGSKRYMVVEAIPGGGWDWSAWANDGSGRCLHGRADTPGRAMVAAERGAMLLARTPISENAFAHHRALQNEGGRPN